MTDAKKMGYAWMSYDAAHAYEKEAAALGVSTVARSTGGFMREYQAAGSARAMHSRPLPSGVTGGETWGQKRENFIKRHMAGTNGYARNPTRRRFLALVMWAYKPPGAPPSGGRRSRARSRARSRR